MGRWVKEGAKERDMVNELTTKSGDQESEVSGPKPNAAKSGAEPVPRRSQ